MQNVAAETIVRHPASHDDRRDRVDRFVLGVLALGDCYYEDYGDDDDDVDDRCYGCWCCSTFAMTMAEVVADRDDGP